MSFLESTNLSMNSKFDLFYEKVSTCVDFHAPVKKNEPERSETT